MGPCEALAPASHSLILSIKRLRLKPRTENLESKTDSSATSGGRMTIVEMYVHMDCSGCERKIRKALHKLEGVHDVDVFMARQKVTVSGWVDQKKALKAVRKTGRRAVLWPYPMNTEEVLYAQEYSYHPAAVAPGHRQLFFNAAPRSSYNYRKHGYDDLTVYGYYNKPPHSHIIDDKARAMFSDDNPNACSIM